MKWKFVSLNAAIYARVSKEIELEKIEVPAWAEELEPGVRGMFKGPKIEKFYISRSETPIGLMGHTVLYPAEDYDYPSFGYDWGVFKNYIFHLVDIHPLRKDEEYRKRYVEPIKKVYDKYVKLHPYKMEHRVKWDEPFRSGYDFGARIPHEYVGDSINMIVDYLNLWLEFWREAEPQKDPKLRAEARAQLKTMRETMKERDPGRGSLVRKYGRETAEKLLDLLFG